MYVNSQDIEARIAVLLRVGRRRNVIDSRQEFFFFPIGSRSALQTTQPHTRRILGALSPRVKESERQSSLRMSVAILTLFHIPSWCVQSEFNLHFRYKNISFEIYYFQFERITNKTMCVYHYRVLLYLF